MADIMNITVDSCTQCPGCHRRGEELYCFFAKSTDKEDVLVLEEDMVAEDVPTECPLFNGPIQMTLAKNYLKEETE